VGKLYVFLREVRHELFDADFEAELAVAYGTPRGTEPLPPALLAMVTLLQAYDQVSDAEAVVTAKMDKRWQLVLGCLGADEAPFSQGVLVRFRQRMVAHDLDRKLLDRTVELARKSGKFGWQKLKVALDSAPLLGAGRVEDTWNLIGRALRRVVDCVAKVTGVEAKQVMEQAGLDVLGGSSIKAALDADWDTPEGRQEALDVLLDQVEALHAWVEKHAKEEAKAPPLSSALGDLASVLEQDLEPDPRGGGRRRIRDGVARDRMPSLGDREMRHGRKSSSKKFVGYKRHVSRLVGADVILAATARPANQPEHEAVGALLADTRRHGQPDTLLFDRGYLSSDEIADFHNGGGKVVCKPWAPANGGRFTKDAFTIDLDRGTVTCPAGNEASIEPNKRATAHFPRHVCGGCTLRDRCTTREEGRVVTLHPHERLHQQLRHRKKTDEGRAELRERVAVEHGLATISRIQGPRARYKGERKNTFDLRRCAAIANLQAVARMRAAA
jgi:hypothetical protein